MTDRLEDLADKHAISELIYCYCRAVDRLDIPLGHSIWHEDGHADYGADYYQGPGKGVIDVICQHHEALLSHSHQVSNILIQLDGERAGSESYVTGTMRVEQAGKTMHMGVWGRYLDAWEKPRRTMGAAAPRSRVRSSGNTRDHADAGSRPAISARCQRSVLQISQTREVGAAMAQTHLTGDLAERLAISDKIYAYCRSVDRLDVQLGHTVFP